MINLTSFRLKPWYDLSKIRARNSRMSSFFDTRTISEIFRAVSCLSIGTHNSSLYDSITNAANLHVPRTNVAFSSQSFPINHLEHSPSLSSFIPSRKLFLETRFFQFASNNTIATNSTPLIRIHFTLMILAL